MNLGEPRKFQEDLLSLQTGNGLKKIQRHSCRIYGITLVFLQNTN
jgi:hypothetical protein